MGFENNAQCESTADATKEAVARRIWGLRQLGKRMVQEKGCMHKTVSIHKTGIGYAFVDSNRLNVQVR
jgi:hypothetical protein